MSGTTIDVVDKEYVTVDIVNKVEIRIINLQLGKFVDVSAVLKQNDRYVKNYTFHIEGEEYNSWGNDDEYLKNLILQKLGLVKK